MRGLSLFGILFSWYLRTGRQSLWTGRCTALPKGLWSLVPALPKDGTLWPFLHHDNASVYTVSSKNSWLSEWGWGATDADAAPTVLARPLCQWLPIPRIEATTEGTLWECRRRMLSVHKGYWGHTQISLGWGVKQLVHSKGHSCWRKVLWKRGVFFSSPIASPVNSEYLETFQASLVVVCARWRSHGSGWLLLGGVNMRNDAFALSYRMCSSSYPITVRNWYRIEIVILHVHCFVQSFWLDCYQSVLQYERDVDDFLRRTTYGVSKYREREHRDHDRDRDREHRDRDRERDRDRDHDRDRHRHRDRRWWSSVHVLVTAFHFAYFSCILRFCHHCYLLWIKCFSFFSMSISYVWKYTMGVFLLLLQYDCQTTASSLNERA